MQALNDFADSLLGGALLVALALVLGGTALGLVVVQPWRDGARASVGRRTAGVVGAGALAVAALQALDLALKLAVVRGWTGADAFPAFAETLTARAGVARIAAALAVAAAAAWAVARPAARARWAAVTAAAATLAAAGAWLAHAAGRLESRAPLMLLTVAHQVAAAVWVGGVLHLLVLRAAARRDPVVAAGWPSLVRGFAVVAVTAVVMLLAAGVALAWPLVGGWDGLVGSGYGSLVVTKSGLMAAALALGALGHRAARGRVPDAIARVPALAGAEAIVLVSVLFTAAGLAGQPPPVDTPGDRASLAEVAEVFRPKWPSLRTPPMAAMIADTSDPLAVDGGQRTPAAYRWSNFSHNVGGLILLAMSVAALAARARPGSAWRHWPVGFVGLAVFVFLRSSANDGIWPYGPVGVWESIRADAELLQHRLGALLALLVGLVEWRVRVVPGRRGRAAAVFPLLCICGGVLLLTHAHAAFEPKAYYLVQVTHTTMGALAVLMGASRWLELRLDGRPRRVAGAASDAAMALVALVLVFYREANVVLPPDAG